MARPARPSVNSTWRPLTGTTHPGHRMLTYLCKTLATRETQARINNCKGLARKQLGRYETVTLPPFTDPQVGGD